MFPVRFLSFNLRPNLIQVPDRGHNNYSYPHLFTASGTDSPWQWVNGSPLERSDLRWDYMQPNDVGRACLLMVARRRSKEWRNWVDTDCTYDEKAVCEKPLAN